jgi:hypothetical protein
MPRRNQHFTRWTAARLALALMPATLATAACGDRIRDVGRAADAARSTAEHLVENENDANRAREAQVLADAEVIQQRNEEQLVQENGGRPRYEIRADPDGFTVYDTENHAPVRVGGKAQAGLKHDQAQSVFDDLMAEEQESAQQFTLRTANPKSR